MKKLKSLILIILAFSLLLVSCGKSDTANGGKSDALILSKKNVVFEDVGDSVTLTATIIENGRVLGKDALAEIVWSSQDADVAVCDGGTVTAVGYGSCVIKATYKNMEAVCIISNPNPQPTISISEHEITFDNIGHTKEIVATSDTGEDITSLSSWVSSNEKIATCVNGVVTAVGYGSCTVTAIYQNSETAICNVTVNNPTSSKLTLSEKELALSIGSTYTLIAGNTNGETPDVTWISQDPEIATCEGGLVTAKKTGICVIIAMTEKNETAICVVTVGNVSLGHKHPEYLTFAFPNLKKELQTVDKNTGGVISSAIITSYKMDTQLLDDGRLVVEITLNGVKTYDKEGIDGRAPLVITTSLYRENNTFLDKKQYSVLSLGVGDSFTIKCSGFTVQTNVDGTARELYMLFSSISQQ